MYIPIDNLYGWIQGISPDIIVSYFYPHGTRKFENLTMCANHNYNYDYMHCAENVITICHDQEPLSWQNFELSWQDLKKHKINAWPWNRVEFETSFWQKLSELNLAAYLLGNFYDYGILVHSEQRSTEVEKFSQHFFPVYYWCHGLLARDWYRYAQYDPEIRDYPDSFEFDFNVYARAWQGTREYRLRLLQEIQCAELSPRCRVTFCAEEHESIYLDHQFSNPKLAIDQDLRFATSDVPSSLSAEYHAPHYQQCAFDLVLETLFDDNRLHLTEKVLRPIACGKPFLLASTHGSLDYLKQYGFETFAPWIDESYDRIQDPCQRLTALVAEMARISALAPEQKQTMVNNCHAIAKRNQKRFFSQALIDQIVSELVDSIHQRVDQIKHHHKNGLFCDFISQTVSLETELAYTELIGLDRRRVNAIRARLGLGQR